MGPASRGTVVRPTALRAPATVLGPPAALGLTSPAILRAAGLVAGTPPPAPLAPAPAGGGLALATERLGETADPGGTQLERALKTSSRPPDWVVPARAGTGSTLPVIVALSCDTSCEHRDRIRAAAPETWGAAIDVPSR